MEPAPARPATPARRWRPASGGPVRALPGRLALLGVLALAAARTGGGAFAIDVLPLSLARVAGLAERAVLGRVTAVEEEALRFEVEEVVFGAPSEGELEVIPYRPWPAGTEREIPYAPGQAFLLFLRKASAGEGEERWRVVGAGGEGEMPTEGGWVYLGSLDFDEDLDSGLGEPGRYRVHGAEIESRRLPRERLVEALRGFRECFEWVRTGDAFEPRRTCDDETLAAYRCRSPLHEHLAATALERIR